MGEPRPFARPQRKAHIRFLAGQHLQLLFAFTKIGQNGVLRLFKMEEKRVAVVQAHHGVLVGEIATVADGHPAGDFFLQVAGMHVQGKIFPFGHKQLRIGHFNLAFVGGGDDFQGVGSGQQVVVRRETDQGFYRFGFFRQQLEIGLGQSDPGGLTAVYLQAQTDVLHRYVPVSHRNFQRQFRPWLQFQFVGHNGNAQNLAGSKLRLVIRGSDGGGYRSGR